MENDYKRKGDAGGGRVPRDNNRTKVDVNY